MKKKPIELYNKISQGKDLTVSDLLLTDYEEFLNMWVSAKFDAPMEWTDLD